MKRILLIDDEDNILSIIERFLVKQGYEVVTANNWEDALDQFIQKAYDLVILDINMAGRDGFHVAEEMKATHPEQKILLMTGLPFYSSGPTILSGPFLSPSS